MIMQEDRFNKLFNIFILAGMTVCVVFSTLGKVQQADARVPLLVLTAFGALAGIASTVLAANGSIWNFLFGLIDVCIYSLILFDSKMPTQLMLHLFYFLPMEFIGFFQWRKRGASGTKQVKTQRLRGKKWLLYAALYAGVYVVSLLISWFALKNAGEADNHSKMYLDAFVTTSNIVALVMMTFAYVEQWYLWILVNISSIILWSVTLFTSPDADYAIIPLIKYAFYLLNCINGIRIWMKLSRKNDNEYA